MYHSYMSKTTSIIKTIKGARSLPTLRLEEGDCAPIFVQIVEVLKKNKIHFLVTYNNECVE